MALGTLLLKEISSVFDNIKLVRATSDLKLLSVYQKNKNLVISLFSDTEIKLNIIDVKTFAWQEDNYSKDDYKLLVVTSHNEISYHSIVVTSDEEKGRACSLEKQDLSRWNFQNIFRYSQELAKSLVGVSAIDILRFEAKEAIFVFDRKIVVSFFPSNESDPQILSISDLREENPRNQKLSLVKDVLFVLNEEGTTLSIHSFLHNTKIADIKINEFLPKDSAIKYFSVNLKLDLLVLVTNKNLVYVIPNPYFDPTTKTLLSNEKNDNSRRTKGIVTAFAKNFPSVKGIGDKSRRFSNVSSPIAPIPFSCDISDYELHDVMVTENKLCFSFFNDSGSIAGIQVLDSDEDTRFERFSQKCFFILTGCGEVPHPLLLFSGNKVYMLLHGIEKDKLVNELMVYPSSATVEKLSVLNNWTNIQMDVEVLRLGLSNRQLYTVEFFLKTLFEGFRLLWHSPINASWLEKVEKENDLWDVIANLVFKNVQKNLSDSYTCQYAEQLLHVIIGMVIQIMNIISHKKVEQCFSDEKKRLFLMSYNKLLLSMRAFLREQESSESDADDSDEHLHVTYDEKMLNQWKKWEDCSPQKVIEEAILNGMIPTAQSYFSYYHRDPDRSSFAVFEEVADVLIFNFLRQGLVKETITVMENTGIDISTKLFSIYKTTSEKSIRSVILQELQERGLLSESDLQLSKFLSLLENLYPCTSFEHAQQLLNEKSSPCDDLICAVPENEEALTVGDFMDFHQDNSESDEYCRLVVDWMSAWDEDVKSRILAPHYLRRSPILEHYLKETNSEEISKASVWCYLLENGNIPYLLNWIDIWLGLHPSNSDGFSIFDRWPISEEMINLVPKKATAYVVDAVLNALAKNGIFCEDEQESISLMLNRMGRAQCDLFDESIFSSEHASLSYSDLCHRIIHYSLKHNLVPFLYYLIENAYHKFKPWPTCALCNTPTLNLAKASYLWSKKPNDPRLAFDASVGITKYLYNVPTTSIHDIFLHSPAPLSLATFLLKPESLNSILKNLLKLPSDKLKIVKDKFRVYPLLSDCLFKTSEDQFKPDVTVYELLKGSTIFDTAQLFGWQPGNTLRSEDSMSELPHFSLSSLSEQYGLKKELTFLYYLMEARPHYAYLKFIASEVVLETGLSLSRVCAFCQDITDYALSNYRSPEITASCISFIELLGRDSLALRVCLVAANILHETYTVPGEEDKAVPDIGLKFKHSFVNKDTAVFLISELESIVLNSWNPYSTESNALLDDIVQWMPVMSLSHLFEVEAGNAYLSECAKQNSWLKFLVFAQIFQVPKDQVVKLASKFSNSCISYHIFHSLHRKSSLLYDVAYETSTSTAQKAPAKDTRKSWYSRIGVIKGSPVAEVKKEAEDDRASVNSEETSSSSDLDLKSFVLKDLISQLILAHGSDAPWDCLLHISFQIQNPSLAILAASYPEAPLQTCVFLWLYTSLGQNESTKRKLEEKFPNFQLCNCSTDDVENIMLLAVSEKRIITLWLAVHYFLPKTPLPLLVGFLRSFLVYKKYDSSIELFQNKLWDYPKGSNHSEKSILHSILWIENVSVTILKEAVIQCDNSYERLILLRHFSHTRIGKSFSKEVNVPEFMKVYQMVQCLGDLAKDTDVAHFFLPESNMKYKNSCWEAVSKLLRSHLCDDALTFANVAKLPQDQMLLMQINQETEAAKKTPEWKNLLHRIEFWKHNFGKLKVVNLHSAIDFLEVQSEISDMYGERYFLMKSIIEILKESASMNVVSSDTYSLEMFTRKMWWFCIKAQVHNQLCSEIFNVNPEQDVSLQELLEKTSNSPSCIEDEKEMEALGNIIGQFLLKKNLSKAFELSALFGYNCLDLKMIKVCHGLAKSTIVVSEVDLSDSDFAQDTPSARIINSLILWVLSSVEEITSDQRERIQCMQLVSRKCPVAVMICHQILVHYIVSLILNIGFDTISKEKDIFNILKGLLIQKLKDGHLLAKSLIIVHELPDKEIAKFLSSEIWHSLQLLNTTDLVMIPEEKSAFSEKVIYDPLCASEGFNLIVKLCQDTAVLGQSLMHIFNTEFSELSFRSSEKTFSLMVELLICAHECFSAACNMDGISHVLHNAQCVISLLEESEKFNIMVHLLTGLGRYSEMIYAFDILKSHDKLKLLFDRKRENDYETEGSGSKLQNPELTLALLDYLKHYPSSEGDFYEVARRFGMYRVKAEILEMSAQKQLSQLCKRNAALDNELAKSLEKALQVLSEAAKSYCKAECLHQAQNCTRLAQLVALQVFFIPSGIWIIGLDESSVARFITHHDKFSQAFIVAEEYRNHHLWSTALLQNAVVRGDRAYLKEFQAHFGLTSTMISDVAKKFLKIPNKTESIVRNMKQLLSLCSNVKTKYTLATELGFLDLVSELMMGEGSSYLTDLIANNTIK